MDIPTRHLRTTPRAFPLGNKILCSGGKPALLLTAHPPLPTRPHLLFIFQLAHHSPFFDSATRGTRLGIAVHTLETRERLERGTRPLGRRIAEHVGQLENTFDDILAHFVAQELTNGCSGAARRRRRTGQRVSRNWNLIRKDDERQHFLKEMASPKPIPFQSFSSGIECIRAISTFLLLACFLLQRDKVWQGTVNTEINK